MEALVPGYPIQCSSFGIETQPQFNFVLIFRFKKGLHKLNCRVKMETTGKVLACPKKGIRFFLLFRIDFIENLKSSCMIDI